MIAVAWIAITIADSHFDGLERLRGAVIVGRLGGARANGAPAFEGEVARLHDAIDATMARGRAGGAALAESRLAAVLATLTDGIVVVTEAGQVSLVNGPARQVLGAAEVACGTSVFAALDRASLTAAMAAAAARPGAPVARDIARVGGGALAVTVADLPGHGGAVLRFAADPGAAAPATLDHDLSLHDRPPEAALDDATPLAALPGLVFDGETTGLDVVADRLVAAGAVRVHGATVYRAVHLDALVDPGVPIPASSTAIHGITDAMVAEAPPFADLYGRLRGLLNGVVMIGHNIGFDAAILRAEAARAGLDWPEPERLDTLLLAAALWPEMTALDLEDIAARLGVDVRGRHTALGDALVTADIWSALVPLLADAGVRTFAEARAFAASATRVLARQRAAGW